MRLSGTFPIFSIFDNLISWKGMVVERIDQNLTPGGTFLVYQDTQDTVLSTVMCKFILGSFSAFPTIDKLVPRKRLVIERNRAKCVPRV